jgi:hypothetical protein
MGYSAGMDKDDDPLLRNLPEKHPISVHWYFANLPCFLGRKRRFSNSSLEVNLSISKFCERNFEILLFLSKRYIWLNIVEWITCYND